ncbi:hypothetical protein LPJ53_005076 [Coemansia erecta]|uniref:Uncharacterized protein n=1 Tax=Coemansia erecta TaxID=147472 RepID=A0A9W7XWI5_9FUNG|nr:hypothetical protein LPJ53_005076 [Coemansia erecta]
MPTSSHSPVPSLTHEASRASSASSSVTSLSPGALAVATPRDLMPQFAASLDNPSGDAKKMPLVSRHHQHHHHKSADAADNSSIDPVGLKRRASSQDDIPATTDTATSTSKRRRTVSRRRDGSSSRPPKRLTGSADFVKRFGLVDLYDQFVRPYVSPSAAGAGVRQQMPDLASAYLRNVHGAMMATAVSAAAAAAAPSSRPMDLMALVMAPPKNEFERLDLLPMASIKAAFSISSGNGAADSAAAPKRSRISLKYSTDSPQQQQQQQSTVRRESSSMSHRK